MKLPSEEFNLSHVRTYPLQSRSGEVNVSQLPRRAPTRRRTGTGSSTGLQRLLAGEDFRAVVAAVLKTRRAERPIVWGLSARGVKTGLSTFVTDLMRAVSSPRSPPMAPA